MILFLILLVMVLMGASFVLGITVERDRWVRSADEKRTHMVDTGDESYGLAGNWYRWFRVEEID